MPVALTEIRAAGRVAAQQFDASGRAARQQEDFLIEAFDRFDELLRARPALRYSRNREQEWRLFESFFAAALAGEA